MFSAILLPFSNCHSTETLFLFQEKRTMFFVSFFHSVRHLGFRRHLRWSDEPLPKFRQAWWVLCRVTQRPSRKERCVTRYRSVARETSFQGAVSPFGQNFWLEIPEMKWRSQLATFLVDYKSLYTCQEPMSSWHVDLISFNGSTKCIRSFETPGVYKDYKSRKRLLLSTPDGALSVFFFFYSSADNYYRVFVTSSKKWELVPHNSTQFFSQLNKQNNIHMGGVQNDNI